MSARRLAALLALALTLPAAASAAPDPAAVTAAVRKGTDYLRQQYAPGSNATGGEHGTGTVALAGLAMIEGKVSPDDPALKSLAQHIRTRALTENKTYRVSLCLIFLDKYGDPRDIPLVQVLGVRLYQGMNASAGWTYSTWPDVAEADASRLASLLGQPGPAGQLHPEAARQYLAVRAHIAAVGRPGAGDDNSNTQFGLIGLWVAARHHVPVADALFALEARFLRSQNRTDGGWGYTMNEASSTSMTCAGLLALAAGAALRETIRTGKNILTPGGSPEPARPEPPPPTKASTDPVDPFARPRDRRATPNDPGKALPREPEPKPEAKPEPVQVSPAVRSAAVQAALMAVGRVLGSTPHTGAVGPGGLSAYISHGNYFYLLWSVERVGVAYGLETIGDVNWYDWGSAYLLAGQAADGSWGAADAYGAGVNTPFAILFLTRANLIGEITRTVKDRYKDPGRAELRGGGSPPLLAPRRPEPNAPPIPAEPTFDPTPLLPVVKDTSEAWRQAGRLATATDDEWPDRLVELRDSKGPMYTLALARAAATLDGVRRKQARDTLADRLVRMTPPTLRGLLRDPDPELRRAAALACGVKADEALVPDLIARLTDPSELVGRAARASLRAITSKDFGPEPGAPDAAKVKAAEDWRAWADAHRSAGGKK